VLSSVDAIDPFLSARGETKLATVPGKELEEFGLPELG